MTKITSLKSFVLIAVASMLMSTSADAAKKRLVDDVLRLVSRESPHVVTDAQRAFDQRIVEGILSRHGDEAARFFREGGYPFLAATRKLGDDAIRAAYAVPGSARYIGTYPEEAMRILARYGDDGLLLQVRSNYLLTVRPDIVLNEGNVRFLANLPDSQFKQVTRALRATDGPDSARRLLVEAQSRGPGFLSHINRKTVMMIGGGVVTIGVIEHAISNSKGEQSVFDRAWRSVTGAVVDMGWKIGLLVGLVMGFLLLMKEAVVRFVRKLISFPAKGKRNSGVVKGAAATASRVSDLNEKHGTDCYRSGTEQAKAEPNPLLK